MRNPTTSTRPNLKSNPKTVQPERTENYIARLKKPGEEEPGFFYVNDLSAVVDRQITMVCYVSAHLSNPQGDPDCDNRPRFDPCTGRGYITSQGYKRKIRDLMVMLYEQAIHGARKSVAATLTLEAAKADPTTPPHVLVHLSNGADDDSENEPEETEVSSAPVVATPQTAEERKAAKAAEKAAEKEKRAREKAAKAAMIRAAGKLTDEQKLAVCRTCYEKYPDDRIFGRLFLNPIREGGKGAVQVSTAESLHRVRIVNFTVGLTSVATEAEKEKKDTNLGTKSLIHFGVYKFTFDLNPLGARNTGMTWNDFNMLVDLIRVAWELTQSDTRKDMVFEKMFTFFHPAGKSMGLCKEAKTIRLIKEKYVGKMPDDGSEPIPTSINDYEIGIDASKVPAGMQLIIVE